MNQRLTVVMALMYAAGLGCLDSAERTKETKPPASIPLELPHVTVKTIARAESAKKNDDLENYVITYVIRNPRSKNCVLFWTEPRLSLGLDNAVFSQSTRCYRNTWFDLPLFHCQVIPPGEAIEVVSKYAVRRVNSGGLLHTEFAFSYDESNEKVKGFMSLDGTNTYGRQMYDIETNTDLLRVSVQLP